jgi:DNA-binding NtrC family response regulator
MNKAKRGSLLVIDDESDLLQALCDSLTEQNYQVKGTTSPEEALHFLRTSEPDILISDLMMPDTDGIALLRAALTIDPNLVGLIMTGQATVPTAIEAMKTGAFDYILKPFRTQTMLVPILERAMSVRRLRMENVQLKRIVEQLTFESPKFQIIGSGPKMQKVTQLIEKVAPSAATVLIRGPSGTGKELVARALHGNSQRHDKPLVTINCATLQEHLLESELFGHEKGSFTGADKAKLGLFEIAKGGSLFIDEVAEMAPAMQAKLLRVLENGQYRRVGGTQEYHADVRIIAATNKPLEEEQKAGRFREDLFYRLNVITIELPPLRDRREDIPALVNHILKTRPIGRAHYRIAPEVMTAFSNYDWPGNIRELVNVIERAQILAEGDTLTLDDLPETLASKMPSRASAQVATTAADTPYDLEVMERRHVQFVLNEMKGNKVQTAHALRISRRSLYRLLEKYGLDNAERKTEDQPALANELT